GWPCSSRYSGRTVAPSPRRATTPACARPSSRARPSWPWGHCPLSGSHASLGAPWPHPRSPAQAHASPGLRSIHPHHILGRDATATLNTGDALLAVEGVGVEEWYDSSCYIQG